MTTDKHVIFANKTISSIASTHTRSTASRFSPPLQFNSSPVLVLIKLGTCGRDAVRPRLQGDVKQTADRYFRPTLDPVPTCRCFIWKTGKLLLADVTTFSPLPRVSRLLNPAADQSISSVVPRMRKALCGLLARKFAFPRSEQCSASGRNAPIVANRGFCTRNDYNNVLEPWGVI